MEILKVFYTLTLRQVFWKTKIFFKKLEYCFSVESANIENPPSPHKTAISEANFKTNRKVSTKWTYQRHYAVKGLLKEKNMDFITTKVFCI